MSTLSARRAASRKRAHERQVYVHRFIDVPGAPPLPRDVLFPKLITIDGKLPPHMARFRYVVERLN